MTMVTDRFDRQSPPDMPPSVPRQQITAEQLAYYLFGNPMNPQDKGIIGQMQDQVKQLVRLGWAMLFTFTAAFLAAVGALIVDLLTQHHP